MPLERQPAWLVGADNQYLAQGSGVTVDLDPLIQTIILFCNGKFSRTRPSVAQYVLKREIYILLLFSSATAFY